MALKIMDRDWRLPVVVEIAAATDSSFEFLLRFVDLAGEGGDIFDHCRGQATTPLSSPTMRSPGSMATPAQITGTSVPTVRSLSLLPAATCRPLLANTG